MSKPESNLDEFFNFVGLIVFLAVAVIVICLIIPGGAS